MSYCEKENEVHYNPYVEPSPADDEIWYTTTDGNIISNFYASGGNVGSFYGADNNKLLIESNTYENGKGIMKCNDSISSLGYVFEQCSTLLTIQLSNSIKNITTEAFKNCTSLHKVILPDFLTNIGKSAFQACTSLTGITIPESVTTIGFGAFYNCSELSNITIKSETPPTLGSYAFWAIASDAKFYVPSGSVDAYKSATNWSDYADKIQAIS